MGGRKVIGFGVKGETAKRKYTAGRKGNNCRLKAPNAYESGYNRLVACARRTQGGALLLEFCVAKLQG
jgi:hypothetical protein